MPKRNINTAKEVSIAAMSAALYAVFFFLSSLIGVPSFVVLYLPIVLLGVFPIWFGRSGLMGGMIGAFIGGFYVESLGYFAWIESATTLIIYGLNWLLISEKAAKAEKKVTFATSRRLCGNFVHWHSFRSLATYICWIHSAGRRRSVAIADVRS
jgi:hypothetical protein